jgi:hypothetical protein
VDRCWGTTSVTKLQSKETLMSSRGKKKTTMAKLSRESRLRERRQEKQAKKEARRNAPPEEPTEQGIAVPEHDEVTTSEDVALPG